MNDSISPHDSVTAPPQATEPAPVIPWGWLRALLMLPAWFITMIVALLATALSYGITSSAELEALANDPTSFAMQAPAFLAALISVFLFRRFVDRQSFVSLGFQFCPVFRRDLFVGMAMGMGLIALVFGILLAVGGIVLTDTQPPGGTFAVAVVVMIMVGIGEELVMRGYIQSNLMTSMNKYVALLVTSLLFSFGHLSNPNASWLGLVNIILAGLLLGVYYVHKRNLWLPIGLHFTWNLFQGSVFGSPVSGVTVESIFSYEVIGSDLLTGGSFGFEASLVTTGVMILSINALHLIYRPRPDLIPPFLMPSESDLTTGGQQGL